jgi:hypothetical protein
MTAGWPSWLAIRARTTEGGAALTEGFAIGVGWLMLFALLGLLAYFLLRKPW